MSKSDIKNINIIENKSEEYLLIDLIVTKLDDLFFVRGIYDVGDGKYCELCWQSLYSIYNVDNIISEEGEIQYVKKYNEQWVKCDMDGVINTIPLAEGNDIVDWSHNHYEHIEGGPLTVGEHITETYGIFRHTKTGAYYYMVWFTNTYEGSSDYEPFEFINGDVDFPEITYFEKNIKILLNILN